mmetsp:Transcript_10424/g.22274  ORF Transcript_10424/g.22274 Transcript_10424/m.22274 type:complete len:89 (-) Transcript_10424:2242-2508(-)
MQRLVIADDAVSNTSQKQKIDWALYDIKTFFRTETINSSVLKSKLSMLISEDNFNNSFLFDCFLSIQIIVAKSDNMSDIVMKTRPAIS